MLSHLSDQEFMACLEGMERGEALPADLPADDAADLELAGRLLAQQVLPSPRLVAAVQQAMTATSPASPVSLSARWRTWKRRRLPMSAPRMSFWKGLAWTVATVLLAFALVMLIFPSARAAVLEAILRIGGITFVETERIETGDETTWSEQIMSLAEAQATLPFAFKVPTWAPEGYVLNENEVAVARPYAEVTIVRIKWENAGTGSAIYLQVMHATAEGWEVRRLVGNGAVETALVSGQEVALVRGGWDHDTGQYMSEVSQALEWREGGVYYHLAAPAQVAVEDLVHMVESMPR